MLGTLLAIGLGYLGYRYITSSSYTKESEDNPEVKVSKIVVNGDTVAFNEFADDVKKSILESAIVRYEVEPFTDPFPTYIHNVTKAVAVPGNRQADPSARLINWMIDEINKPGMRNYVVSDLELADRWNPMSTENFVYTIEEKNLGRKELEKVAVILKPNELSDVLSNPSWSNADLLDRILGKAPEKTEKKELTDEEKRFVLRRAIENMISVPIAPGATVPAAVYDATSFEYMPTTPTTRLFNWVVQRINDPKVPLYILISDEAEVVYAVEERNLNDDAFKDFVIALKPGEISSVFDDPSWSNAELVDKLVNA